MYGDLAEEICLEQRKGFWVNGVDGKKLVCQLQKAIYGLKSTWRVWWKLIDLELKEKGFISYNKDVCMYTWCIKGHKFILTIYVDNLVIASTSIK